MNDKEISQKEYEEQEAWLAAVARTNQEIRRLNELAETYEFDLVPKNRKRHAKR